MADEADTAEDNEPKKSKSPLILGLILALVGGAGGFYATSSGMILGGEEDTHASEEMEEIADPFGDIAFVAVEPMVISVDSSSERRLLRFRAQLEVPKAYQEDVTLLLPRVVDVLNSYLNALEISDLENQSALMRLRAQMLRRVQVVTGRDRVNDFLIMEFVLT
ncbi:MAG: flagellar basal body-associated FliL family protein [Sulfitobacter sp.]